MYLDLSFSVAVHLTSVLLLLDEVFAVGDASFQQKPKAKMNELQRSGAPIIMVSYNECAIIVIFKRCFFLDENGSANQTDT